MAPDGRTADAPFSSGRRTLTAEILTSTPVCPVATAARRRRRRRRIVVVVVVVVVGRGVRVTLRSMRSGRPHAADSLPRSLRRRFESTWHRPHASASADSTATVRVFPRAAASVVAEVAAVAAEQSGRRRAAGARHRRPLIGRRRLRRPLIGRRHRATPPRSVPRIVIGRLIARGAPRHHGGERILPRVSVS